MLPTLSRACAGSGAAEAGAMRGGLRARHEEHRGCRHQPHEPHEHQRRLEAAVVREREQDRRREGPAQEAGEGVHREGPADPVLGDALAQHGVVGRVIDAVGEPRQHRHHEQPGIGADEAERQERKAAESEARDQDRAGADPVHQEAHGRLGEAGDDIEGGERQPEIEEAHAQPLLEQRQHHRQHHDVEMADQVRRRDGDERLRLARRACGAVQPLCRIGGH